MRTAEDHLRSHLFDEDDVRQYLIAKIAMKSYAEERCEILLDQWIRCKFGYGNDAGLKFKDEWLKENIK